MNTFLQQHGEVFVMTQALRLQLMGVLSDADLTFSPGGANIPLGALLVEMGEVQRSYIDSFMTHKHDWSWRQPDKTLSGSVSRIAAWYSELDAELKQVMEAMTDADLQKTIDRGWPVPVAGQLHIYREGLLIFYARASIYLKAMNKALPGDWPMWIG